MAGSVLTVYQYSKPLIGGSKAGATRATLIGTDSQELRL